MRIFRTPVLSRHPAPRPVTYARGRKCLDYGFVSNHVVQALVACGYDAFNAWYTTDHQPYFFDFDTDKLFGNAPLSLASHTRRILRSTNVKQGTQYIKIRNDLMWESNTFSRARQLRHPGTSTAASLVISSKSRCDKDDNYYRTYKDVVKEEVDDD